MKKLLSIILLSTLAFASVDINTASLKELTTLNGIGKKKAEAIVAYRKTHCFKSIDELTKIKGIGKKLLQKNKNRIKVGKCKKQDGKYRRD